MKSVEHGKRINVEAEDLQAVGNKDTTQKILDAEYLAKMFDLEPNTPEWDQEVQRIKNLWHEVAVFFSGKGNVFAYEYHAQVANNTVIAPGSLFVRARILHFVLNGETYASKDSRQKHMEALLKEAFVLAKREYQRDNN